MPKGTRKVVFPFDESRLTHFGGMWLIQQFCQRLRLRARLQQYVRTGLRVSDYPSTELFLALLFSIIMGLRRINKTEILQYNGSFLEMLGLERFPDQTTLRRFLRRLSTGSIRQLARLHDSLRAWLYVLPTPRSSLVLDVDSVVLEVFGHAQGAAVGYPLGKIPTQSWTANVAFFQLLLLAANLVHWFKRLCLPASWSQATLETIRTDFLVLPAKLVRVGHRNVVKLPHDYHHQREFLQAARSIARLRVPGMFRFCQEAHR